MPRRQAVCAEQSKHTSSPAPTQPSAHRHSCPGQGDAGHLNGAASLERNMPRRFLGEKYAAAAHQGGRPTRAVSVLGTRNDPLTCDPQRSEICCSRQGSRAEGRPGPSSSFNRLFTDISYGRCQKGVRARPARRLRPRGPCSVLELLSLSLPTFFTASRASGGPGVHLRSFESLRLKGKADGLKGLLAC